MLQGLIRLEDRIVFDGADVAQHSDNPINETPVHHENTDADRLLVVDEAVEYSDSLATAVRDGSMSLSTTVVSIHCKLCGKSLPSGRD